MTDIEFVLVAMSAMDDRHDIALTEIDKLVMEPPARMKFAKEFLSYVR